MLQGEDTEIDIGNWQMIPLNAFLYFPQGDEVRSGEKEKAWRKIFQNDKPYDSFQQQKIDALNKKLQEMKVSLHPWFNKANKLRFLQANKFKVSETCKSIKEACAWRNNDFPVKVNDKIQTMLNSGGFYFCGRDNQYRPILVSDISKFKEDDINDIPAILMVLIEFMIKELLIPGQVQNYVLILNLEAFGMGMKDTVMKIVSFTSNTYRSRLFASYLLSMPSLLTFAWDSLASKFVSQNTLRKIKISKTMNHNDMWTHIDKRIIERKYGGEMTDISGNYWPPPEKLMNFQPTKIPNKLISKEEYNNLYENNKLKGRKVEKKLLKQKKSIQNINKSIIRSDKSLGGSSHPEEQVKTSNKMLETIKLKNIRESTNLSKNLVKGETEISIRQRRFDLFFKGKPYQKIKNK